MSTVIETAGADAPASSAFFTVACPGMGCHQNCPLQAEVRGGRLVGLTAAPVPGAPEDAHACLRGLAAVRLPYMPQRLKYRMRRLGKRGEGDWERTSWDEAYRDIASRLEEIRDRHGPRHELHEREDPRQRPLRHPVGHPPQCADALGTDAVHALQGRPVPDRLRTARAVPAA